MGQIVGGGHVMTNWGADGKADGHSVIGWVGMTGNTGGPHVCYRFWKNGKQVDPFKQKLPSAKPLKKSLKPSYKKFIEPFKTQLDNIEFPNQHNQLVVQK